MKPVRGGECPGIAAGVVLHAADLEEHHAAQGEEDVQFNPLGDHVLAGADDFGGADEGVEFDEHAPLVYPEVYSSEMDSDKETRDNKSRHVMKKLKIGRIPFRTRLGELRCPFCKKGVNLRIDSLISRAVGIGKSLASKHKSATKAKHAAYGKFLREYVKTGLVSPYLGIGNL